MTGTSKQTYMIIRSRWSPQHFYLVLVNKTKNPRMYYDCIVFTETCYGHNGKKYVSRIIQKQGRVKEIMEAASADSILPLTIHDYLQISEFLKCTKIKFNFKKQQIDIK